tara:strand:- start:62 stop:199 length:138 start_codon:yes stop_codon:yes gene_type:complete
MPIIAVTITAGSIFGYLFLMALVPFSMWVLLGFLGLFDKKNKKKK